MPGRRRHPGLKPPTAAWARHGLSISAHIRTIAHDLPVRLIPNNTEIDQIRADSAYAAIGASGIDKAPLLHMSNASVIVTMMTCNGNSGHT